MKENETLEDDEEYVAEADDEEGPDGVADEADEEGDASLDEILAKKPEERAAEDEDDDSILALGREERLETLSVKVVPKQESEFVCRKCYLVKPIRSQLADKKRMYCRDCV